MAGRRFPEKDHILRAEVSKRLCDFPCAHYLKVLAGPAHMQKRSSVTDSLQDPGHMQRDYYLNQKKTLEINPRHPLIKELLRRWRTTPPIRAPQTWP